jgi:uncharacterized protein (TIGR02145 family)
MKHFLTALLLLTVIACKKDKKSLASLTTTAATNITASSVSTGGNITNDGNSGITQRGIVWATHTAPTVGDSITSDGAGTGTFITNLSGLNANTNYYIRAYAVNESGTAYGNEITLKTAVGFPTVFTTAVTNIQPLNASSGGNITNDGGAAVTERGVVYATTANPTINNFKIIAGTGTGTFTATLSPLASQTTYYVRAYAINSYGTAYGSQIQFNSASANTVTDIDGNVYPYVNVCGKDWLAANLKTSNYKNGDAITNGSVAGYNWLGNTAGAYTYPNGDQANEVGHGKLYNLEAVRDGRGICPTGWHVATDADWQAAEVCQGMAAATASTNGDRCCGGNNFLEGGSSGLEVKRSGYFFVDQATGLTEFGGFATASVPQSFYWTATVSVLGPTFNRFRVFNYNGIPDNIYRQSTDRSFIQSVRCVKD